MREFHCFRHIAALLLFLPAFPALAELRLPAIFGDRMVLQRDREVKIWGWAGPGQQVNVSLAGQNATAAADGKGRWEVKLAPLATHRDGLEMKVTAGSETKTFADILVGEVWLCSGQSNMQWSVAQSYDADLESLTANFPKIRLITIPQVGTQELQDDFKGSWEACSPQTLPDFSAVGYYFGKQLFLSLDVPIGLIDNSWGGSAAEAWIRREVIEANPAHAAYVAEWKQRESAYDHAAEMDKYMKTLEKWEEQKQAAAAAGKPAPERPRSPSNPLTGQHRPGNLYAGVLHPIIGCAIRGVIWYQGESNAGRAYNYRQLFPDMITHWRNEWGQGDFPFYWVQLADYMEEHPEPKPSNWAELREAQTLTLKLANTGQAVIYDLGEGSDIHPRNKADVGKRLARIALARDYGKPVEYRGPSFQSMEIQGKEAVLTFEHVGSRLYAFDLRGGELRGFTIAGEDQVWHNAKARVTNKNQVTVWSDAVAAPVAVRYAWADNPVANLRSFEGLPAVPFRTDDWKLSTQP